MSTREIQLSLPVTVVYVTGTVNGIDKTFTLNGAYWTAVVDRVENETYKVNLLAINSIGISSTYETTIYYGIHLITDRTKNDVLNKTSKGFYNHTDLNRVESSTKTIAENLSTYGYPVTIISKTDWSRYDKPYGFEMERYLFNINKCIKRFGFSESIFEKPETMRFIDYNDANNIEKTLEKIDSFYVKMKEEKLFSGTIYGGDQW